MSNERDVSYISRKMRVLSLFAAFAIVFIHSGCLAGLELQSVWCQQLVDICTQKMTCMEIFYPGCDIPHFPIWFGAALWLYLGMFFGAWGRGALLRRVGFPWPVAVVMSALAITTSFLHFPCSGFVTKLLFIAGIWYLYDAIEGHLPEKLPQVFYWSFWIYCTHNILMTYVLAGLRFAFGKSDIVIACLPFVATSIVLACCILMAFGLNRIYPRGFAVLCGGRA